MLNAGVIGMGIGEKHVLAYQNHYNTNLKTVCDFDHDKLKELSIKFPNVCMETKEIWEGVTGKMPRSDKTLNKFFDL